MLSYSELAELVERGVISGVNPGDINAASIDLHLGRKVWIEDAHRAHTIDISAKGAPAMTPIDLLTGDLLLWAGDFCLAQTVEMFDLPNDIAGEFKLKSSIARSGLGHLLAGHCDPGWHGSVLTLELVNHLRHHPILLRPGMPIGQIILHRVTPVPERQSYAERGQYNHDSSAQPSKGAR